jgi:hypothetical protein
VIGSQPPTRFPWTGTRIFYCSTANPHPVPAESRWHPPPATADADSCGEQVPVPEVMKVYEVMPEVMKVYEVVPEVMKVYEVVSLEVRATERMNASRSAGHAHAVHAAHAAHRLRGQYRWRGKHRHHHSTSNCDFSEHDNPPDCHPRIIVRAQCKMFK